VKKAPLFLLVWLALIFSADAQSISVSTQGIPRQSGNYVLPSGAKLGLAPVTEIDELSIYFSDDPDTGILGTNQAGKDRFYLQAGGMPLLGVYEGAVDYIEVERFLRFYPETEIIEDNEEDEEAENHSFVPVSSFMRITCYDPDGCNVNLLTTGMLEGLQMLVQQGTSEGDVTLTDSATIDLASSPVTLSNGSLVQFIYATGKWREIFRNL